MEQISGIFFFLCASVFAPLFLARFVVHAEWRTIRNACLIWYGFLVLAFGGFSSQEGFGWALIFAMFWSIPAVPIISLVLKIWRRIGRGSGAVVTADPDRRWWQQFSLGSLSPAQWAVIGSLLAGFFLFGYWQEQRDLSARADVLRQFFGLPADTNFADIRRISKSSVAAPRVEAIVRFTTLQFNAFAAGLDDSVVGQQRVPSYDGAPLDLVSPENVKWRDLPVPAYAGNRRVAWHRLSETEAAKVQRGWMLCIALQWKPRGQQLERSSEPSPRYTAKDCSTLARTERVATIVLGALDFDTRTLHVMIN